MDEAIEGNPRSDRDLQKAEKFGKASRGLRGEGKEWRQQEVTAKHRTLKQRNNTGAKRKRKKARSRKPTGNFAADVKAAADTVLAKHAARFSRAPTRTKRRALALFSSYLPPLPKRPGRRPNQRITMATHLYLKQVREVQQGRRANDNWPAIAEACHPGFSKIATPITRARVIKNLKDAVKARLKRQSQSRRNAPSS